MSISCVAQRKAYRLRLIAYNFFVMDFLPPGISYKSIAMTNNEILKADLLDIIFEHRNKSYGAYTLRRYYNNRLMTSLGIALSAVALLFLISFTKSRRKTEYKILDNKMIVKVSPLKIPKPKEPPQHIPAM